MLSSFSASSYAARSSATMAGLSALSASGRFSVIVTLWQSTSYLMNFIGSPSTELRCALFAECCQAFFEIGGPTGQLQIEQFLGHSLVKRGVLSVIDGL